MRTSTLIEVPQNDAREYFTALGITAVFIAASPARSPCTIGCTQDLAASLDEVQSSWHSSVGIAHAWWLASDDAASKIVAAATEAFPTDNGRLDATADTVAAKVEREAAAAGVILTTHTAALQRVQAVVDHVDGMIASANATGELRWLNKRYKQWRLTAPPDSSIGYSTVRSRLRAAVVRSVARGECRLGPQLWNELGLPGSPGQ